MFYDLPYYSHLYSEMCNLIPDPQRSSKAVNWDVTALYTKYDAQKLGAVVGNERAAQMINAKKKCTYVCYGRQIIEEVEID